MLQINVNTANYNQLLTGNLPSSSRAQTGGIFNHGVEGARQFYRSFAALLGKGSVNVVLSTGSNLSAEAFANVVQADLKSRIYNPGPEVLSRLNQLNLQRAALGQAPISFHATTQRLEGILNNPSTSVDQKRAQIGTLTSELGMSQKDMSKLFTNRLAREYLVAANQMKNELNVLRFKALQSCQASGLDNIQATMANMKLEGAEKILQARLKQLERNAIAASKPKGGFFSFFKKLFKPFTMLIGKLIKPITSLLSQIFKPLTNVLSKVLKPVVDVFKKILKPIMPALQIFSKIMDFAAPLLSFVPGIGQAIAGGWSMLKGVMGAIQGKGFNLFQSLMGAIPGVGGIAGKLGEMVSKASSLGSKLLEPLSKVTEFAKNLMPNVASLVSKVADCAKWIPQIVKVPSFLSNKI